MLAAVQLYNNPQISFKAEAFITLAIISWTYLLHAYYRTKKIKYRYYSGNNHARRYMKTKTGAYRYWELERCLRCEERPLGRGTTDNLHFLIEIRNEIEHQLTHRIDEYISAKLQACALNYSYWICESFGQKYSLSDDLALAIQFSAITPGQQALLTLEKGVSENIRNFVAAYETNLDDTRLSDKRYAYRPNHIHPRFA